MKKVALFLLCVMAFGTAVNAQKIETSYWNCVIGDTYDHVLSVLEEQNYGPIVTDDGVFLRDRDLYGIDFATIGMKFTSEGLFYNVFGYNKYTSKKEANSGFDAALSEIRSKYPNVQSMSKSDNCLRLYAYTDDSRENVFSLGLYRGSGDTYFVRLNIYSDYLVRKETGR